jgi:hypothetical protein
VTIKPTPVAEEEEIDPLEAFMSSLYGTGDVAVQKDLTSEVASTAVSGGGNSRPGAQSITLEEILKGSASAQGAGTPPSPQFAPALNNYPSSSSLMAKSPSLRTLSATMSTSFDNMNRGWESDAPEGGGVGFTIGNEGMDDADGTDDNGEVPWHLMSSTEKKKLQHHRDRYVMNLYHVLFCPARHHAASMSSLLA